MQARSGAAATGWRHWSYSALSKGSVRRWNSTTPLQAQKPQSTNVEGADYATDSWTNVTPSILSKLSHKLHTQPAHPLGILRSLIEAQFPAFNSLASPSPVVSTYKNFDELGFPIDHPGRSVTDSYYLNSSTLLRTHTSAHEVDVFKAGHDKWLLAADVYRRDEIDASHHPVFHQMEGARTFALESPSALEALREENAQLQAKLTATNIEIEDNTVIDASNPPQPGHDPVHAELVAQNLKHHLNSLIYALFSKEAQAKHGLLKPSEAATEEPLKVRWIPAYFPFTSPSYEVEVLYNGKWLEILGSGVVQQRTLDLAGVPNRISWAFGLGLERIAMVLFSIPDIRLFWSTDPRFLDQFQAGKITTFKPYSKYPPCYKDVSFWLAKGYTGFHENDLCDVVRDAAGNLVEDVRLIDEFVHPKTERRSVCYRINYRSMDRSLSNEEVNSIQDEVIKSLQAKFDIELR
ncbi:phenylalanyl-tRNA synthetase [Clavulina sp. PMI_390]|nr:phenylalanyl-tRNA synthetase [Clavulina sp. PMI_390]